MRPSLGVQAGESDLLPGLPVAKLGHAQGHHPPPGQPGAAGQAARGAVTQGCSSYWAIAMPLFLIAFFILVIGILEYLRRKRTEDTEDDW